MVDDIVKIENGGRVIAYANFLKSEDPVLGKIYYIERFWVDPKNRGDHLGSELIELVNEFIHSNGGVGFLWDQIGKTPANVHAKGLYERHGWSKIHGDDRLTFYDPLKKIRPSH